MAVGAFIVRASAILVDLVPEVFMRRYGTAPKKLQSLSAPIDVSREGQSDVTNLVSPQFGLRRGGT